PLGGAHFCGLAPGTCTGPTFTPPAFTPPMCTPFTCTPLSCTPPPRTPPASLLAHRASAFLTDVAAVSTPLRSSVAPLLEVRAGGARSTSVRLWMRVRHGGRGVARGVGGGGRPLCARASRLARAGQDSERPPGGRRLSAVRPRLRRAARRRTIRAARPRRTADR